MTQEEKDKRDQEVIEHNLELLEEARAKEKKRFDESGEIGSSFLLDQLDMQLAEYKLAIIERGLKSFSIDNEVEG